MVQHNENANPPTLYLALESLIAEMEREGKMVRGSLTSDYLAHCVPAEVRALPLGVHALS